MCIRDRANGDEHQHQQHQNPKGNGLIREGQHLEQGKAAQSHGKRGKYLADDFDDGERQHISGGFGPANLIEQTGEHQKNESYRAINHRNGQTNAVVRIQRAVGKEL